MSTRSMIGMETSSGIRAIYCHNDGYISHHAPLLEKHYATEEAISALLDLGNLSSLGAAIGEAHDFATHDSKTGWCLAYGRDRQETGTEAKEYATERAFLRAASECDADYIYLFRAGRWHLRAESNEWVQIAWPIK